MCLLYIKPCAFKTSSTPNTYKIQSPFTNWSNPKPNTVEKSHFSLFSSKHKWLLQFRSFSEGPLPQPSSPSSPAPFALLQFLPLSLAPSTPTPRSQATIKMIVVSLLIAAPPTGLPLVAVTLAPPSSQVPVIWVRFIFTSYLFLNTNGSLNYKCWFASQGLFH